MHTTQQPNYREYYYGIMVMVQIRVQIYFSRPTETSSWPGFWILCSSRL